MRITIAFCVFGILAAYGFKFGWRYRRDSDNDGPKVPQPIGNQQQLQLTDLPEITDEQKEQLKVFWAKIQASGNKLSEVDSAELNGIFTEQQMQQFAALRAKLLQDTGNLFKEFLKNNPAWGQLAGQNAESGKDLVNFSFWIF